ncbi:MAG: cation transporter, partial [Tepidisphaeraceae bacterium]
MSATENPTTSSEESALLVGGMTCASCVAHVEKTASRVPGVEQCDVNLARGRAVVRYDPERTDPVRIADAITDSGYPATPEESHANGANAEQLRLEHQHHESGAWLRRAIVGIVLWFPVEAAHWILHAADSHKAHGSIRLGSSRVVVDLNWMTWLALATSTISLLYVGAAFYRSAWGALKRRTSNMDTLIAMGASVAYGYSAVALAGYLLGWWNTLPQLYFMEATGLLALISLGHWLEARARGSAGKAIHELLELAPATALRLDEGSGFRVQGSGSERSELN